MTRFQAHMCSIAIATAAVWPLAAQVEPGAGNWTTWVLTSGAEVRLAPPPGTAETAAEIQLLKNYIGENQSPEIMPGGFTIWVWSVSRN